MIYLGPIMFFFECPSLFSMTSVPPHLWNAFEHVQRCSEGALFAFVDIHRFVDGNAQIGLIAPSISRTCTSCWRKMAVISVFCPHTKNGEQLPNPIICQNKKRTEKIGWASPDPQIYGIVQVAMLAATIPTSTPHCTPFPTVPSPISSRR